MRHWIDLVSLLLEGSCKPATAQLLMRLTADTPENREHLRKLKAYRDQIDWEEAHGLEIPDITVMEVPSSDDKEAWDAYWYEIDYRYEQLKREQDTQQQKQLELDRAVRDKEAEMIARANLEAEAEQREQDNKVVDKLAKQAIKSAEQRRKRLKNSVYKRL